MAQMVLGKDGVWRVLGATTENPPESVALAQHINSTTPHLNALSGADIVGIFRNARL